MRDPPVLFRMRQGHQGFCHGRNDLDDADLRAGVRVFRPDQRKRPSVTIASAIGNTMWGTAGRTPRAIFLG